MKIINYYFYTFSTQLSTFFYFYHYFYYQFQSNIQSPTTKEVRNNGTNIRWECNSRVHRFKLCLWIQHLYTWRCHLSQMWKEIYSYRQWFCRKRLEFFSFFLFFYLSLINFLQLSNCTFHN